ncbi:MAG: hypothetical protein LC102_00835 [Ignavibacteriales bacterium]|nr:MAG: hypothetical protein F9K26_03450 [Ignavibacteriaceae bacterium]MBW7872489.1 hypothetical protein [Ignavibacteria bacterium]MCZ2141958.1 hypothetical protein [Ignavibacteriales bacterium]OQY69752.1 MAG: hypothetical protein B6D45_12300 [Ignavibacteriales bacterium UTCHB3]MBV6445124.1 hypothetical protein [Ignavibacteriaceae bacterium]
MRGLFFLQFSVFLMLSNQINAQTDDLQLQKDLVDSLLNIGDYYNAYIEAERLAFFDSLAHYTYFTDMGRGRALKATGQLERALPFFEGASKAATSNADRIAAETEILKIFILTRKFERFDTRVKNLSAALPESEKSFAYWQGWRFAFAGEWEAAKQRFASAGAPKLLLELCDSASARAYSMGWGMFLSAVLPGAGQVYAGEYINSAITLGWVAFGVYLVVDAIQSKRFFDAIVELNYVLFRFYRGNLSNTKDLITRKNNEIMNEILRFLQNNYTGPKP